MKCNFRPETVAMLQVRELQLADIPLLLNYWYTASPQYLNAMGVSPHKMPSPLQFGQMLEEQLNTPVQQKKSYCLIWLQNERPIGHCNTNPTEFGKEATMHLHLWNAAQRQKGLGTSLVKLSLPYFFNTLQLKTLWCQPRAMNTAPNKTLEKAGFEFIKEYTTIPGYINFEQVVKLWRITKEKFTPLH